MRFSTVLDSRAIDGIYLRVLDDAKRTRALHESLARATSTSDGKPPDPVAPTREQILELITTAGHSIVASGRGDWLITVASEAGLSESADPQVRLILAYANFTIGRYLMAEAHLAEASLKKDALPDEEKRFLSYVADACAVQAQKISFAEYAVVYEKSHERSQLTIYRDPVSMKATCELHKFETRFPSDDADAILAAFKSAFCSTCKDRKPYEPPRTSGQSGGIEAHGR